MADTNPHIVSTACDECGTTLRVDEERAARRPVTCKDCEHDCVEGDHLIAMPDDPALPPHIVHYECDVCGEWWLFDTETGDHEVDR